MHGLRERPARSVTGGHGGDHRVAGAGNIEHRAGAGGDGVDLAGLLDQRHALLGPRGQDGAGVRIGHHVPGRGDDLGLGRNRHARRQRQFLQVRGDAGRAAIAAEVAALRIDEGRNSRLFGQVDDGAGRRPIDHTLVVVRQNHRADLSDVVLRGLQQGRLLLRAQGVVLLLVRADHLLLACDEACLADGGALARLDAGVVDAAARGQDPPQSFTRIVRADQADDHGPTAEGGDVAGHIARATQHLLGAAELQHRHRRLGGNPFDVAVDVSVEHQVADAEHGDVGEIHGWESPRVGLGQGYRDRRLAGGSA